MLTFRFIAERKFGSAFIRWATWAPYSHVEMVLPEGYLGARLRGGVRVRSLNYTRPSKELLVHVNVTPDQEKKALAFARAQLGQKYDWLALVAFMLHSVKRNPKRWFCSELVTATLEIAGVIPFNRERISRITPRDLAIWTGWSTK